MSILNRAGVYTHEQMQELQSYIHQLEEQVTQLQTQLKHRPTNEKVAKLVEENSILQSQNNHLQYQNEKLVRKTEGLYDAISRLKVKHISKTSRYENREVFDLVRHVDHKEYVSWKEKLPFTVDTSMSFVLDFAKEQAAIRRLTLIEIQQWKDGWCAVYRQSMAKR